MKVWDRDFKEFMDNWDNPSVKTSTVKRLSFDFGFEFFEFYILSSKKGSVP